MASNEQLIHDLMTDVVGSDQQVSKDEIVETISNILKEYNLSTDLSFVQKIATMKFSDKDGGNFDIAEMPKELTDAAFLPVNTISDIALRQDLDLIISQIPEWYTAVQITRDAICESDVVDGTLARSIVFDKTKMDESETTNIMSKIEEVEDRMKLHAMLKNHIIFDALLYGESYVYNIPYAKVFEDLYKYRLSSADKKNNNTMNMFETSSVLNGYGYGESAVEISLNDTIINDSTTLNNTNTKSGKRNKNKNENNNKCSIFTEAEIMEINPGYHSKNIDEDDKRKQRQEMDDEFDEMLTDIAKNIRYINEDVALPVIEESAHDLKCVYEKKYSKKTEFVNEVKTFFEQVMETSPDSIGHQFERIKGIYTRILPATKLIPIRVDRNVIGYYYISDLTRPEESGQRRNSGLSGYTLRSPSVGYDTFSPDKMFCEKLANKIINNFDLKFMRDNTALHQQIVAILQSHKFNESLMRFVFIPAEHVTQFTINEDGMGKGHSMLEPGLVTARMYMFLKLYSLLYQINNSQIRVYNLRTSGIDKNYRELVQETMRKFAARRITANDIFNYRSSMTKVSGGSELIMPVGTSDRPPITIESIPAAEAPINNDLLDSLKHEAINGTPVPSLMVMGGMSEIEFAKETELANTRFNTMVSSLKIDLNSDTTTFYRRILRWETDIDPMLLRDLKFVYKMPTAKQLTVTAEMINNFNAVVELAVNIFLSSKEVNGKSDNGEETTDVVREYKKLLIAEYLPQLDIERLSALADKARNSANKIKLDKNNSNENLLDDEVKQNEGEMM
jgi:hypothetical protein